MKIKVKEDFINPRWRGKTMKVLKINDNGEGSKKGFLVETEEKEKLYFYEDEVTILN